VVTEQASEYRGERLILNVLGSVTIRPPTGASSWHIKLAHQAHTFLGPCGFLELFLRLPMVEKRLERLAQKNR
jgi:hypothetical protein